MDDATIQLHYDFYDECALDYACKNIWNEHYATKWGKILTGIMNKEDFTLPSSDMAHKIQLCFFLVQLCYEKSRILKEGTAQFCDADNLCKKFDALTKLKPFSNLKFSGIRNKLDSWIEQDEITAEEIQVAIDELKEIFEPAYKSLANMNIEEACQEYERKITSVEEKPRASTLKSVFLMKYRGLDTMEGNREWDLITKGTHPDVTDLKDRMAEKHGEKQAGTSTPIVEHISPASLLLPSLDIVLHDFENKKKVYTMCYTEIEQQEKKSHHSPKPSTSTQVDNSDNSRSVCPSIPHEFSSDNSDEVQGSVDESSDEIVGPSLQIGLKHLNYSNLTEEQHERGRHLLPGCAKPEPVKHSTPSCTVTSPEEPVTGEPDNRRHTVQDSVVENNASEIRKHSQRSKQKTDTQCTNESDADDEADLLCESDVQQSSRTKISKRVMKHSVHNEKKISKSKTKDSDKESTTSEHTRDMNDNIAESASLAAKQLSNATEKLMNIVKDPYNMPSSSALENEETDNVNKRKATKWNAPQQQAEQITWSSSTEESDNDIPPQIKLRTPKMNKALLEFANQEEAPVKRVKLRKKKRFWTDLEADWIREGVQQFGEGNWADILKAFPFVDRSSVAIKDKYRNMKKNGEIVD